MTYLSQLTLCRFLPNDQRDQLDAVKSHLVQNLERQSHYVEAQLNDGVFLDMLRSWLRCEDERLPADCFYWQHASGAWMITLRLDGEILPVSADYPSVEVGHCDDLPQVMDLLKRAVKAGELDQQLKGFVAKAQKSCSRKPLGPLDGLF